MTLRFSRSRPVLFLLSFVWVVACATPTPTQAPVQALSGGKTQSVAPVSTPGVNQAPALPIDPATLTGKLDNGLTWFVRSNKKPEQRASLRLIVNAGLVLEDDTQRGLAHFVEHMAFNGTTRFQKQEIVGYLEKAGVKFGQHTNAFTGFDETVYMLEVPTDNAELLETAFVILQQFAAEISFDPKEVDKERGVVIEEWRLGRGAGMRVLDQQLPIIFQGSRYADRLPIGTVKILETATADDLRKFYRDFYRPNLMAVVAVGDFAPDAVQALIRKHFVGLKNPTNPKPRPEFPIPGHKETLAAIAVDKELPQASVAVLYKLPHRTTTSRLDYRRMIVERLYQSMLNTRLQELAQGPNPPFFYAASMTQDLARATDLFAQIAVVKQDAIELGLASLLREVERVDRHGFTSGEFERTKIDTARAMESAVKEKDKVPSSSFADEIMRYFLTGELMPGIEIEKSLHDTLLPGITLEEVNRVARNLISDENRVLMLSAPATAIFKRERLLSLFPEIAKETLAAYVDKVRNGPLVGTAIVPGKIVAERMRPEIGVTEWLLQNGIRVVLKPTDFQNDQILLQAFSPGGHSLESDANFPSASFAAQLVDASGVGEFGPVELKKALAGKIVGVSPFISELEEGFRGTVSPTDLESAFELAYLAVTAPRTDGDVFSAWHDQMREQIANRGLDPETVFQDAFSLRIFNNHLRRRPPTVPMLEKVKLERVLSIYKARFKNFSDATFVFVGNFSVEAIRPLLLKYLGGLPGKAVRLPKTTSKNVPLPWRALEKWKDVGAPLVSGVQTFEVRRGVEPKSSVHLTFSGDAKWSLELEHAAESLSEALEIRLREVVREDLSGTYGISVQSHVISRPKERYRFDVSFGCAPANVERLTKAVWDELARVKTEGFAEEVMTKIKSAQMREFEVNLKQNGFWIGDLAEAYRFGRDPSEMLNTPKRIAALNSDLLRDTAKQLLNDKRHVLGVLKPEP
ncbi:MAG: insulinase family protein [Deltaproteobacteria bacterium]|nr:insulinase family protein [Deltaproteobacteria bacterium]